MVDTIKDTELKKLNLEKEIFKKLKASTNVLPKSKLFYNFILNALVDSLQFEIGFETALSEIKLNNIYDSFTVDKNWIEKLRKEFSHLMFLDRMIHLTGNSGFRDEIISEFIKTMFKSNNNNIKNLLNQLNRIK